MTRIALNGMFWGQETTGSGQYLHHLLEALGRATPEARLYHALAGLFLGNDEAVKVWLATHEAGAQPLGNARLGGAGRVHDLAGDRAGNVERQIVARHVGVGVVLDDLQVRADLGLPLGRDTPTPHGGG